MCDSFLVVINGLADPLDISHASVIVAALSFIIIVVVTFTSYVKDIGVIATLV